MATPLARGVSVAAAAAAYTTAAAGQMTDTQNLFALMEDIVDKLKILNYENEFLRQRHDLRPLSRTYFCVATKASEQFPYFAHLVSFLLKSVHSDFTEFNEFDDPNTISSNIFEQLRRLGFSADFPASKLRHGNGDCVLHALDFLLDKALAARRWTVAAPVYVNNETAEEAVVDEQTADEDMAEAEPAVGDDDDTTTGAAPSLSELDKKSTSRVFPTLAAGNDDDDQERDKALQEIKSDPQQWFLELEKVQHRLKFKAVVPPSKEWRTHLESSVRHGKSIDDLLPPIKTQLEKMSVQLRKILERVSGKERHINKEFEGLGKEFQEKQKALDALQERQNALTAAVNEAMNELQMKTDAVEQIKNAFAERNNSMTDTTPLRRISNALAVLKKEVAAMELRIGVVSQTLLQATLKSNQQMQLQSIKQAAMIGRAARTAEDEI